MSRQLERFLKIDALIRSSPRQTCCSLAEALEVTDRTIRSDIAFLQNRYHAPLEYDRALGWHYTDPTWRLPSISLSLGELFALILGARMLEAYGGSAHEAQLRTSIERLSERLPEQTWIDLQQLANERIVFHVGAETHLDPEIWMQLLDACSQSRQVWMRYYTANRNAVGDRVIDPYYIYLYRATNPYVIGFCHQRQAIRTFRVDRIKQLRVLDETFNRDPNFDPKTYLAEIFQNEVGGHPVPITIWFDAATAPYIRERRWHATQEIEEHEDESLTLHLLTSGLNDLKRWVLGYGKGAVVKGPPELVQLVRAEVEGMSRHYCRGGLGK
ncbi:MAG: WYL domain-containing protein [Cyanobacteriota bacterium]|nr:WYL domain-containing protein [Cyanobacteriota bacterium]